MQLVSLRVTNYRTLVDLQLGFPSPYSAICGKNDSGKTNVIRILRAIMKEEDPYSFRSEQQEISVKDDFPKWLGGEPTQRSISVIAEMRVNKSDDTAFYEFLVAQLGLKRPKDTFPLVLEITHRPENQEVIIKIEGRVFRDLKAQEVLKRLQSSHCLLFYNSTELGHPGFRHGRIAGFFKEFAGEYSEQVDLITQTVNRKLRKIARQQQQEFAQLLGRLEKKYRVAMSVSSFDLDYLPYNISLSSGKVGVSLSDWGSGTRNRTLILLTLFRARQIKEGDATAAKVTPVIVIEEPESFLHPSAQAEFGRILQDLSQEFGIQVITTTHSPYLLSTGNPTSNILLERKIFHKQPRETIRIETTGENWMQPFGIALGVDSAEFSPWKDLFFNQSKSILLAEGEIDKTYFTMLQDQTHGASCLKLCGDIFAYGGKDVLRNTVLLKFVKERYRNIFITYDLDADPEMEKTLTGLGLKKGKHYMPLGIDAPGKRNIEGLLPESIRSAVYGNNPGLVDQATQGTRDEKESARGLLKKLLLEEFQKKAKPGEEYFGKFYEVTRIINAAFSKESSGKVGEELKPPQSKVITPLAQGSVRRNLVEKPAV